MATQLARIAGELSTELASCQRPARPASSGRSRGPRSSASFEGPPTIPSRRHDFWPARAKWGPLVGLRRWRMAPTRTRRPLARGRLSSRGAPRGHSQPHPPGSAGDERRPVGSLGASGARSPMPGAPRRWAGRPGAWATYHAGRDTGSSEGGSLASSCGASSPASGHCVSWTRTWRSGRAAGSCAARGAARPIIGPDRSPRRIGLSLSVSLPLTPAHHQARRVRTSDSPAPPARLPWGSGAALPVASMLHA